jgi:plasmid stabilization system protein ParE
VTTFVLTPLAVRDLDEIWNYLAEDNLQAADRVLLALEKAMNKLARRPGIGHLREDLADKRHKFFLVHSYLIIYRPQTKPLDCACAACGARFATVAGSTFGECLAISVDPQFRAWYRT